MVAAPFFSAAGVPPQLRVIASGAVAVLVCVWLPVSAPPVEQGVDARMIAARALGALATANGRLRNDAAFYRSVRAEFGSDPAKK